MRSISWEELYSRSYVPYSGINEACIIIGKSGTYYPGVRVENVSFPLTVESVQSALFSCLSEGDAPVTLLLPEGGNPAQDSKSSGIDDAYPERNILPQRASFESHSISFWCETFGLQCMSRASLEKRARHIFFKTIEEQNDVKRLAELTNRCIIPYSSFPVTALLVTDAGIFSGVNIEVPDWQKGLCAERTALVKAISSGANKLLEIHVYAPQSDYVSPCGACRQVLLEHMSSGKILLHHNEFELSRLMVSDLLPYQFKAQNLKRIKS